jgi:glycosyltransferase involved in cell wall biosynthesis
LFQHNVEAMIWKGHVEHSGSPLVRAYFQSQYERMRRFEGQVCRAAKAIIAVSSADARAMESGYGASRVRDVPTGVDLDYFRPPVRPEPVADLVFLGSMDWMPNIDGIKWFVSQVLPLVRKHRPDCSLAIVGRRPPKSIRRLTDEDERIEVTGTVDDVRPYLWGSAVSIVPLRIGGGTRLKIYESMAAKIPVVSTTMGAEGLDVCDGQNIHIADSALDFAGHCVGLLEDACARRRLAGAAWEMIAACYSWEVISRKFEQLLT